MDDIDQKLLRELRRDARQSLSVLAGRAGVSRATARTRIERMRAKGDIQGYTVVTDRGDGAVRAWMSLAIEGAGTERIMSRLTGWSEVAEVHTTNGRWDLLVEFSAETLQSLDRTLIEIRKIPGVIHSETSLLLSTRRGG